MNPTTGKESDGNTAEANFAAVDLPCDDGQESKPKPEWTYHERRAYIFRRWMDEGSHKLLNKSELARDFDVTRVIIYRDLDRVADSVEERLAESHGAQTKAVFEKAVAALLNQGDYKKAAKVQDMMGDWLERRGEIHKEPERIEARQVGGEDLTEEQIEALNDAF